MAITEYTQGLPYVFTPLPWDAIAASGMAMQQRGDENVSNLDAVGALEDQIKIASSILGYNDDKTDYALNPYTKDKEYVRGFFDSKRKEVEDLVSKYGDDMSNPQVSYAIKKIQRDIQSELNTGGLARVQKNAEIEAKRQEEWVKNGKIWSKEPGKAHDFLVRGNQFMEKGDWLENAPIGEYTDRINIIGTALARIPETVISEQLGTDGKYIRKRIVSGFGTGNDYKRFNGVVGAIFAQNTELAESVSAEVQQKLYQQGMDWNDPLINQNGEVVKDENGNAIPAGMAIQQQIVGELLDYAEGFKHAKVQSSMSADSYGVAGYRHKLTEPKLKTPKTVPVTYKNDQKVVEISNEYNKLLLYAQNLKIDAEKKAQDPNYKSFFTESYENEFEALKNANSKLYAKHYNASGGDPYVAMYSFIEELKNNEIAKVQGTHVANTPATADAGKAEVEGLKSILQNAALYQDPNDAKSETNSVTLDEGEKIEGWRLYPYHLGSGGAAIAYTTNTGRELFVNPSKLDVGTKAYVDILGTANSLKLDQSDASYEITPATELYGNTLGVQKLDDGRYAIGKIVENKVAASNTSGYMPTIQQSVQPIVYRFADAPKVYNNLEELNLDFDQLTRTSINPNLKGHGGKIDYETVVEDIGLETED